MRHNSRFTLKLVILGCVIYPLFSYFGIRSPDSEIMFRTAQSLALHGSFAVPSELNWKGFGLPKGTDGRRYSVFGPGQAVAALPLVKMVLSLQTHGYLQRAQHFPISHYVDDDLFTYLRKKTPARPGLHLARSFVSVFNIIICIFIGVVFLNLLKILTGNASAAFLTTLILMFGTLFFPYSGTFFSEPLATLFSLASLTLILKPQHSDPVRQRRFFLAGLFLGIAVCTHISAILFVPFWLTLVVLQVRFTRKKALLSGLLFACGISIMLCLLGYFNFIRFGSFLETGRTADASIRYAVFTRPWRGLKGLLWSSGKGLFLYCPAVIPGILAWPLFFRKHRGISITLLASVIFRIIFIAARSDWHGGFCLGPRYLLMIIPVLLIPIAFLLPKIKRVPAVMLFLFTWLCIAQQIFFNLGEIFSFLHVTRMRAARAGINIFYKDLLYFDWHNAPVIYLLFGNRGPFLLRNIPFPNLILWLILIFAAAVIQWSVVASCRKTGLRNDAFQA